MKSKILTIPGIIIILCTSSLKAQIDINNAQAVFIYNFLSHVQWPDNQIGDKYIIGIYGKTTTYNYLKKYTSARKVGNRSIEIIQMSSLPQAANCHIVLVATNKSSEITNLNSTVKGRSCLIIGEKSGSTDHGAVVDFHIVNNKLRYKIDPENAKSQKLFVSQALLNMSL